LDGVWGCNKVWRVGRITMLDSLIGHAQADQEPREVGCFHFEEIYTLMEF